MFSAAAFSMAANKAVSSHSSSSPQILALSVKVSAEWRVKVPHRSSLHKKTLLLFIVDDSMTMDICTDYLYTVFLQNG
jgi:hypothetical protein